MFGGHTTQEMTNYNVEEKDLQGEVVPQPYKTVTLKSLHCHSAIVSLYIVRKVNFRYTFSKENNEGRKEWRY